jgi:putative pyruvate formate lyase activating enzyme
VFCQNFETSQFGEGAEVSPAELADIMVDLQSAGCHNVSFVTPEHVVPQILEALPIAIDRGLRPPLVYNTSAYDSLESIQLMEGIVDVYMPDFKLWHTENCRNYLVAIDYAGAARTAIAAMHAQVGAKGG